MAEVAELPAIRLYSLSLTVGDTAVPGVRVITVEFQAVGISLVAVMCARLATVIVTLDVAMPFAFVVLTCGAIVPAKSLANVTHLPLATRLLKRSATVAVRMLLKPTVCETGRAISVKLNGTSGTKVTFFVS